ncbi:MAG: DNA mismatch repair endonuclease MutL, partial [Nitrospirota bacterium]|nr:DNA mismatch repair endonuclease MutL [Nitrospirota bacterium]
MIRLLPDDLINKIAAGEVVERPASVVKELVENSIDAGCTEVSVDIADGGKVHIRVVDNGHGMGRDDALLSVERHATSKIRTFEDLEKIASLGFRGEALPSIAAVSRFTLTSSDGAGPGGTRIEIDGGRIRKVTEAASPRGTEIEVRDLFHNVPARRKFLKSGATEMAHISHFLDQVALCYPGLYVRLTHNNRKVSEYPPVKSLQERVLQVYGSDVAEGLLAIRGEEEGLIVRGLVSRPGVSRGDRKYQELFVNGRWVRNNTLNHALYEAYHSLLMRDRHPMALLFVEIDPAAVDVNVHPAKSEVRFHETRRVHDIVRRTVQEGLLGDGKGVAPAAGNSAAPDFIRYREPVWTTREAVAERPGRYAGTLIDAAPMPARDREPLPERGTEGIFPAADVEQRCFQVHQSY